MSFGASMPNSTRTAIIAPNATIAEFKRREFERQGVGDQFHVICPHMVIAGFRFTHIMISDDVHRNLTRGTVMARKWFHDEVIPRCEFGGQVIILP